MENTEQAARVRPFYCGTQAIDWQTSNCENCHMRGFYRKPQEQRDFEWRCEIQHALDLACLGDGTVSAEIGRRMGHTDPLAHGWKCTELIEIEPIEKYFKRFERPQTKLAPLWWRLREAWRSAREYREASYADEYEIGWRLSWRLAWTVYSDYTKVVKCSKCKRPMPRVKT